MQDYVHRNSENISGEENTVSQKLHSIINCHVYIA